MRLGPWLIGAVVVIELCTVTAVAQQSSKPFTVANYPVEATAGDAVAAKEQALASGQQAAFRSLLKRLVPVTSLKRIDKLKSVKAADYIDGVSVRSERNSSTQYIANLDFTFQVKAVRELLRREGLPFVDLQAPAVIVVPVYVAPPAGQGAAPPVLNQANGQKAWTDAWKGLDLEHALTPTKLEVGKPSVHADTFQMLTKDGDGGGLRILTAEYKSELVLIALAEPDLGSKKLNVTLMGRDGVGQFALKRSYKFQIDDFGYTTELAALIALGTMEGRWKALKARPAIGGGTMGSMPLQPVQMTVEFRSLQEWQALRRQITETPGVEDFQIAGQSGRTADIAVRFPGGGNQLSDSMASQGLDMREVRGTWILKTGG
jgi:Uncharacterized protein conserved in bacteria (DUF2066)